MNSSPELTKQSKYVEDVLKMRDHLYRQAKGSLLLHILLQMTIILGATSLPFILNITDIDKRTTLIISTVVAITAALSGYLKLGERASQLYLMQWKIIKEYQQFDLSVGAYKDLEAKEAFSHFVEQIQRIRDEVQLATVSSSTYSNFQYSVPKEKDKSS